MSIGVDHHDVDSLFEVSSPSLEHDSIAQQLTLSSLSSNGATNANNQTSSSIVPRPTLRSTNGSHPTLPSLSGLKAPVVNGNLPSMTSLPTPSSARPIVQSTTPSVLSFSSLRTKPNTSNSIPVRSTPLSSSSSTVSSVLTNRMAPTPRTAQGGQSRHSVISSASSTSSIHNVASSPWSAYISHDDDDDGNGNDDNKDEEGGFFVEL
jgi:hypothetical protein